MLVWHVVVNMFESHSE